MKNRFRLLLGVLLFSFLQHNIYGQDLDFTIRYNPTANQYEVFAKTNATATNYFIGGGSQISIVFPASTPDAPLLINTVNGGIWTDNSQIFAPSAMPNHDFHSIATNGSAIDWLFGVETLLFTFSIPNELCIQGIRLYDNDNDPSSNEPGMQGSDFRNYFANVFTFQDNYRANYNNLGISCGELILEKPDTVFIPQNSSKTTCIEYANSDNNDTHTFEFCEELDNGKATGTINNNEVCLTIEPDIDFSGYDELCLLVCNQNGFCDSVTIPVVVLPPSNPPEVKDDSLIIAKNMPGIVCLPIKDEDPDDVFVTTLCKETVNGRVAINDTPTDMVCVQYTPNNDFEGIEEVCFVICDADGLCDSATLTVVVGESCLEEKPDAPSLIASGNEVCSGKKIELTATIQDDSEVEFEWYLQEANGDLVYLMTTEHPTLVFENATSTHSGNYLVRTKKGDCVSGFSNTQIVTVFDANTTIEITNTATENQPACVGSFVQLSVPFFENTSYQWSGPNGFTSNVANPALQNITPEQAGEYVAIVTKQGCDPIMTEPVEVFVRSEHVAPIIQPIDVICEGNNLVLNVTNSLDNNDIDKIQYDWYFNGLINQLGTSQTASFEVGPAGEKFSGNYYVIRTVNGCSLSSDTITIDVIAKTQIMATAIADFELCQASEVELIAAFPNSGVGRWSTTTGALILNPNEATTKAVDLEVGLNEFIWTVSDDCGQVATDTLQIRIQGLTSDVAFAGLDQQLCGETSALLDAGDLSTATGVWTQSVQQASQGAIIESPNTPSTEITGLEPGNAYIFNWTISEGSCTDFASDEVTIVVDELPEEQPFIINKEFNLCEPTQITLQASMPLFSTGQWTTNSSAIIGNPSSPTTIVSNLQLGNNQFIWSLSNSACMDFAADTANIFLGDGLTANADEFIVNFNDSLTFDVLENDEIYNNGDFDFIITKYPDFGSLTEEMDGSIKYVPRTNFFGVDNFRYKLCSTACEEVCDTAMVNLRIENVSGSTICSVPNGLTPNGDNANDLLVIPCLFGNTENELKIFNRWGDEVYQAAPYQNDWGGTHDGLPLPAGTYFYVLKVDANSTEAIQGYLTIFR